MIIEMALELALNAAAALPRASVEVYTTLRNRQATRVPFGRGRAVAIRDAREGRAVRIRGRVELARPGAELLSAPVSQRPCVAWSLRLYRREVVWKESAVLHLVADASDSLPLAIVQGDRSARLASPLVDLDVSPDPFEGRRLAGAVPSGLARVLRERGLDESTLAECVVHEHRLTLPAEVEVAGVASLRPRRNGYRDGGTELWLDCLPSGHLPLRPIEG